MGAQGTCSSPAFHGVSALLQSACRPCPSHSTRICSALVSSAFSRIWSDLSPLGLGLSASSQGPIRREIQSNLPPEGSELPLHRNLTHVPTGSGLICLLRDPMQSASLLPSSDLRYRAGPWSMKTHPHAAHTSQLPASISNRTDFQSIPKVSLAQQGPGGAVSLFHKGTPQFHILRTEFHPLPATLRELHSNHENNPEMPAAFSHRAAAHPLPGTPHRTHPTLHNIPPAPAWEGAAAHPAYLRVGIEMRRGATRRDTATGIPAPDSAPRQGGKLLLGMAPSLRGGEAAG